MTSELSPPEFNIFGNPNTDSRDELESLRDLISAAPALAYLIISFRGQNGDRWNELLALEGPEQKYSLRLIEGLTKVVPRGLLGHVGYDPATQETLGDDQDLQKYIKFYNELEMDPGAQELRENVARQIELHSLGAYASLLAIYNSQVAQLN